MPTCLAMDRDARRREPAALTEFEVEWAPVSAATKVTKVKIARASADSQAARQPLKSMYHDKSDRERVTGPISYAIDGDSLTAWTTDIGYGRSNQSQTAVFIFDAPIQLAEPGVFHIYLTQQHGGWNSDDNQTFNVGRFRVSLTADANPSVHPLPAAYREICQTDSAQRSPQQDDALFSYWRFHEV